MLPLEAPIFPPPDLDITLEFSLTLLFYLFCLEFGVPAFKKYFLSFIPLIFSLSWLFDVLSPE